MESNQEYLDNSEDWQQLKDCIAGQRVVKQQLEKYLPYPIAGVDKATDEFTNTYTVYLNGAHFVNFVAEAQSDLTNSAFRDDPTYSPNLSPEMEAVHPTQAVKKLTNTVVGYGRSFVFTDFPNVDQQTGLSAQTEPHPYILVYNPLDVIDWATDEYAGDQTLSYVMLQELKPRSADTSESKYQYRELLIEDSIYKVRIYQDQDSQGTAEYQEYIPTKSNGEHFDVIPGTFCGAVDNLPNVDTSPLLGISNSNIVHYQTWAELTSTTTYLGSPTLALTGLPPGWIKQQLKNDTSLRVGPDLALALEGDSAKAELLEINSDLTHYRTLEKLETAMSEQGYALKSSMDKSGVESATALMIRSGSQMSKLGAIINNVQAGMNTVLEYVAEFTGTSPTTITLNKDFFPNDICSLEAGQARQSGLGGDDSLNNNTMNQIDKPNAPDPISGK